ncbi:hypothetical protein BKA67DRAFT_657871 [Truncatella angustata]|uniref:Uncharacterized protein n=1 Tax=Truncatella angustata TaxID=152316 RepID=A0A9P8UPR3_9PEZI|nr:uncharacterized protein BKA67DRAFT_657871 [Truncatella angustata]KAH6655977.1 hypothetical protein BKA67DRAFT_657871 [Truncatella angustata]
MYAMNAVILSILAAWASASPAVVPKANVANVNMYSGSSCGGSTQSFTVTDGYRCQPVSGAKASISVSENGCATYTWSGTNCQGSSLHINGDQCTSVLFGSVSVQC